MNEILRQLDASLCEAVARAAGLEKERVRLHIPAREAAAACPLLDRADAGIAAAMLQNGDIAPVLDVLPVSNVKARNGWLLFTLSDAFYTAAVWHVRRSLPAPVGDGDCHALNQMIAMARAGGDGCPADAHVQRAWLLTLCCTESGAALFRAKTALSAMTLHVPPAERAALTRACGGVADAAARILYDSITQGRG